YYTYSNGARGEESSHYLRRRGSSEGSQGSERRDLYQRWTDVLGRISGIHTRIHLRRFRQGPGGEDVSDEDWTWKRGDDGDGSLGFKVAPRNCSGLRQGRSRRRRETAVWRQETYRSTARQGKLSRTDDLR